MLLKMILPAQAKDDHPALPEYYQSMYELLFHRSDILKKDAPWEQEAE